MVTCLIAGAAVPSWDRKLLLALQNAVLGVQRGLPLHSVEVLNEVSMPYRRVMADGRQEFDSLLDAMADLGFRIDLSPDGARAQLPELAAALKRR